MNDFINVIYILYISIEIFRAVKAIPEVIAFKKETNGEPTNGDIILARMTCRNINYSEIIIPKLFRIIFFSIVFIILKIFII